MKADTALAEKGHFRRYLFDNAAEGNKTGSIQIEPIPLIFSVKVNRLLKALPAIMGVNGHSSLLLRMSFPGLILEILIGHQVSRNTTLLFL